MASAAAYNAVGLSLLASSAQYQCNLSILGCTGEPFLPNHVYVSAGSWIGEPNCLITAPRSCSLPCPKLSSEHHCSSVDGNSYNTSLEQVTSTIIAAARNVVSSWSFASACSVAFLGFSTRTAGDSCARPGTGCTKVACSFFMYTSLHRCVVPAKSCACLCQVQWSCMFAHGKGCGPSSLVGTGRYGLRTSHV